MKKPKKEKEDEEDEEPPEAEEPLIAYEKVGRKWKKFTI